MKARIAVISAVLVVGMAATALAQPPAGGGMRGGHAMRPGAQGQMGRGGAMAALGRLNLTDDQMKQIHQLMSDTQAGRQADMDQMRKLHEQLQAQVFGEDESARNATGAAQEIAALQAKLIQEHVQLAAKIAGILTPDQRKQVREMPMGDIMGMMMGGGMMGHGAPPKK